jgi:hypothetical protein
MREIRTSGSMSGERKRSDGHRPQVTAPLLDSTRHDSVVRKPTCIAVHLRTCSALVRACSPANPRGERKTLCPLQCRTLVHSLKLGSFSIGAGYQVIS